MSADIREGHALDLIAEFSGEADLIATDAAGPVTDLAAGTAAEHLVCADLLLQGYRAFMTDQNCPYDLAVEVSRRLIRIQVKSTRKARSVPQRVGHFPGYMFQVRRSGKGGQRRYSGEEFDLFALVALDARRIAYMAIAETPSIVTFRPHDDPSPQGPGGRGRTGRVFSDYGFTRALRSAGRPTLEAL